MSYCQRHLPQHMATGSLIALGQGEPFPAFFGCKLIQLEALFSFSPQPHIFLHIFPGDMEMLNA